VDCVNCSEPIRRTELSDRVDVRDYGWVHEDGNPICDLTLVASPGGDGNGPAPIIGYLAGGKLWHPSDVTIVRDQPAP
jgi:hypothetical protein